MKKIKWYTEVMVIVWAMLIAYAYYRGWHTFLVFIAAYVIGMIAARQAKDIGY